MTRLFILSALLASLLGLTGCRSLEISGPDLDDADLRVLFVGNSLTFTHNVPGLVQAMADAAGKSMAHASVTRGGYSLEDHWNYGTASIIRDVEADVVVLQQGSSSLPANQLHLAYWSQQFAEVIRESDGEPALYMVWPSIDRTGAFPDVYASYRAAADSVSGAFIPAGQTWVEAWDLDPDLSFYSSDGLHPSYLGALAAAQTIYAVLFDLPADSVPDLEGGVSTDVRAVLREALAASLAGPEA